MSKYISSYVIHTQVDFWCTLDQQSGHFCYIQTESFRLLIPGSFTEIPEVYAGS